MENSPIIKSYLWEFNALLPSFRLNILFFHFSRILFKSFSISVTPALPCSENTLLSKLASPFQTDIRLLESSVSDFLITSTVLSELLLGLMITGPFNLRFAELQEVEIKLFKTAPSTASAVLLLLLPSLYAYANYSYKINRFETSILCFESLKAFNIYHFATTNSFPLFLLQYKA